LLTEPDSNNPDTDPPNQPHVVAIFALVGMSITGLMAIIGLFNKSFLLAATLFFASFTYFVGYYLYTRHGKKRLSSAIVLYSLYILMVYLVLTGGVASTGPLWVFIVAPVSVYIHGLRRGLLDIALFLIIICTIMYVPQSFFSHAEYSSEFRVRFILSFLTVVFLSALYEYSREKWFNHTLELSKKYQQLALFDPLTKLSNRRNAHMLLQQEQSRVERNNNAAAILLCDVDHFKQINDKYGHAAGDFVLVELAKLFNQTVRHQDNVARWGGEEFLFILPQTNAQNALVIANKLRLAVADKQFVFGEHSLAVTVSFGVAEITPNLDIDQSINIADKYLYAAKDAGRNQVYPQV